DVEDALQPTAEVLGADHGEPRAGPDAVGHLDVALAAVRIVVERFDRDVDAAVEGDVGLCLGDCGHGGRERQSEYGSFHGLPWSELRVPGTARAWRKHVTPAPTPTRL